MDTYLTIMVTVLVATQVIRIAQNTIQLHRQNKLIKKEIAHLGDVTQEDFDNQRKAYKLAIDYFERSNLTQGQNGLNLIGNNEQPLGLPYASVSEIKTKEVKTRLFSNKTKTKEIKCGINYGWMSSNRLDWAMRQIAEYLQRERDELEELRQIDKFCGISKGV